MQGVLQKDNEMYDSWAEGLRRTPNRTVSKISADNSVQSLSGQHVLGYNELSDRATPTRFQQGNRIRISANHVPRGENPLALAPLLASTPRRYSTSTTARAVPPRSSYI
jgi:hypothetical protein